jgi:hypothetical protein
MPTSPSPTSLATPTSAEHQAESVQPASARLGWPWIVLGLTVLVLGAVLGLIMSSIGK